MNEIWLALDLTQKKSTAAICRNGKTVEITISETGDHSENLLSQLEILLKKNDLDLENISRFLTLEGPGSFTGMRIGFATLKAFYFAVQKPITLLKAAEIKLLKTGEQENDIWVVQHLNAKRYLCENLLLNERKIVLEEDLDKIENKLFQEISAKDLCEFYLRTKQKSNFQAIDEIASMSPAYT